ncbi:MAG: zinc-dependent peptidase [Burkholderiales bacterium]
MGWYRNWQRNRLLAREHIDDALWKNVAEPLDFLRGMAEEDLKRLRELCLLFLHEKEMHGAQGLELSDKICLAIAIQACLPILNRGLDIYQDWLGIIVYPGEFRVKRQEMDEHGVVHEYEDELAGEAWSDGPVILSWEDVKDTGAGYNVVIHEFAHKIHMARGDDENIPAPFPGMDAKAWIETLETGYRRFCQQVDRGEETLIDPYASEHPAEFFAVMSETFFTDSGVMQRDWPELYHQLSLFYRQDPQR